jgi:cytochrome c-type biogenesis protein CcsB
MSAATLLLAGALLALAAGLVLAAIERAWAMGTARRAGPLSPAGVAIEARSGPPRNVLVIALVLATACLVAALGLRAAEVGHAPWSNLYEFSQAFAAGLLLSYLILARRHAIAGLAPVVGLLAGALVAYALLLPATALPLVPALQSPLLLTVHVGAAMLAYAISGVAFVAALGELAQRRSGDRIAQLPPAAACRNAAHRSVLLAFPILTIAIVLGSVWANLAWRSYWNNDPKELAAAATWLVYAAYLHVAGRRDRLGTLAPWLLVAGFAAVLFTWLGAGLLFVGQHSYAGR